MCLVDVLIATIGSDHLPIMTSILVGHVVDSKPLSLFKLNVSHLEFAVHTIWNLVPRSKGDKGWILWW
jgi:hypothetical protein